MFRLLSKIVRLPGSGPFASGLKLMDSRHDAPAARESDVSELEETTGVVNNVVFPTGIDKRSDDIFDIYYGMADKYIGVARLQLPDKVDYDEATPPAVAEH